MIALTITTEDIDGHPVHVIDQHGTLGEEAEWHAEAVGDDHGHIDITATIRSEADLDRLIAQLGQLRVAARRINDVRGY